VTDDDSPRTRLRLVKSGDGSPAEPPDDASGDGPGGPSGPEPPDGEGPPPAGPLPGSFARLFDLSGKVALVVGAGGLGSAIAAGLADFGARLAIADLDVELAKRVARVCARPGRGSTLALGVDVTNPAQVRAAVTALEQATDRIDILVNAAGTIIRKPATDFAPAEWRRVIDVNLSGVFYVTQAVGKGMLERGYGRVLTIASVSALLGHPHHAPYAASKGGVALLTKVLATEWASRGVTANAIGPTYVETNLNAAELAEPGVREALIARIPAGRLALPTDIVGAAVYLCSDAAAFVTGQTLYVDGGRTAD
jgi:NAD(P)-dependent dehydrogenase (short-subunit alcohol dehydrogenase family)